MCRMDNKKTKTKSIGYLPIHEWSYLWVKIVKLKKKMEVVRFVNNTFYRGFTSNVGITIFLDTGGS